MTSLGAHDPEALAEALRRAVVDGESLRPGQLRLRLESTLSPDEVQRMRPLVHQVVAAAEENLPTNLTRIAPLTVQSLQRLSGDLAEARGWSAETAQRTTQIWAAALGFADLAASSWPRPDPDAGPEVPRRPGAPSAPVQAATQLPPAAYPTAASAGPDVAPTWPEPHRSLRASGDAQDGEAVLGVAHSYAGIPLVLLAGAFVALIAVLCLPIILFGGVGYLLPLLGALGAAGLVRLGGFGVLTATRDRLVFTPYSGAWRKPRPEDARAVGWSEVTVRPAFISSVSLGGRRIQVGPRNRSFAEAIATHLGATR